MRYDEQSLIDSNGKELIRSFYSTVPEGKRSYREHHHTECEISTIISGSGTYTVNGKEYSFSPGDVFLFSGDEIHCLTDISGDFSLLNIQFVPRILWYDADTLSAMKILTARNDRFENLIDSSNPFTRIINEKIKELHRELSEKKDGYGLVSRCILYDILITLIREYDYVDKTVTFSRMKITVKSMKLALNYIDDNLDSSLTLEDISRVAVMAPTYFSSVFKKFNGISPWEYITIKRVEKAIELIKTTGGTKVDIAMQCGFLSPSNFYKAFYKVTGKKPSDYQTDR